MKENFLDEIVERRRRHVITERSVNDPQQIRQHAEAFRAGKPRHRLRAALQEPGRAQIIGEFKRASPSLGEIRRDADPARTARIYEAAGVCAISVLTEPEYFQGSLEDLRRVRVATSLPILRKDFIVDEYQIDEAALAGADAILLIVAALSAEDLARLRRRAEDELGLDALVEVHSAEEMKRAASAGAKLIGVNNRDLRTFTTSLETSRQLAPFAPNDATLVSESGITSADQIGELARAGFRGFLVGESLMRSPDPGALIRALRRVDRVAVKICGVTDEGDALAAAAAGADMIGLNFSRLSPRCITPVQGAKITEAIRPGFPDVRFVGVFVNQPLEHVQGVATELALDAVQLHGEESGEYMKKLSTPFLIKALKMGASAPPVVPHDCDAVLLDAWNAAAAGGTGKSFPWSLAVALRGQISRLILAGGLTTENVAEAIQTVRPFAVDVCSGVEAGPGRKDAAKVRAFIAAVRDLS